MTAPTTGPRIKVLIAEDEEHVGTILEQFLLSTCNGLCPVAVDADPTPLAGRAIVH
jgi:hypothetical protein